MRQPTALRPPSSFVRTGFTWPAYLMLGYYAFLQAALGPLAPFLQGELHLTYTQTSLLTSAFAGASILVGLLAGGPARLWSRRARFWGGAIGMWVGAAVLMVSPWFVLALVGPFLMGAFGTVVRTVIEGGLADLHQGQRATALTEANVIASIGASSVPLFIGGWQALELGWRPALLVPLIVLSLLCAGRKGTPFSWTTHKIVGLVRGDASAREGALASPLLFEKTMEQLILVASWITFTRKGNSIGERTPQEASDLQLRKRSDAHSRHQPFPQPALFEHL